MDIQSLLGNEQYIIIDRFTMVTAKKYAEIKGLTPARVSQMKSDLQVIAYPDYNLELIMLNEGEQSLAQSKLKLVKPLHLYSYRQLGYYIAKSLSDYEQELTGLERANREHGQEKENLQKQLQLSVLQLAGREQALETLEKEKKYLQEVNEGLMAQLAALQEKIGQQEETMQTYKNESRQVQRDTLLLKEDKERKDKEIESLKERLVLSERELMLARAREEVKQELGQRFEELKKELLTGKLLSSNPDTNPAK